MCKLDYEVHDETMINTLSWLHFSTVIAFSVDDGYSQAMMTNLNECKAVVIDFYNVISVWTLVWLD